MPRNKKRKIRFDFVTIFPEIFDSYLKESLFKRAVKEKIVEIHAHDLRDFTTDPHRKVDDRPFGGGPGMVLAVQPIYSAIKKIKRKKKSRVILFSLRGKKFSQAEAQRLKKYEQLIFICGRYEGVDERVAQYVADEEISIGDFVLAGGELPALVVAESVSRFIPGFLGKAESLEENKGSYPVYTRPREFVPRKGSKWVIPEILSSGNHKKILEWRKPL